MEQMGYRVEKYNYIHGKYPKYLYLSRKEYKEYLDYFNRNFMNRVLGSKHGVRFRGIEVKEYDA